MKKNFVKLLDNDCFLYLIKKLMNIWFLLFRYCRDSGNKKKMVNDVFYKKF